MMLKAGAHPEFAYATKADDASHQIGYDTKSANETVAKKSRGALARAVLSPPSAVTADPNARCHARMFDAAVGQRSAPLRSQSRLSYT